MPTPAQQLIYETHEVLQRNVLEFRTGLDAAVRALSAFEAAYNITADPISTTPTPIEVKPNPQPSPPVVAASQPPVVTSQPEQVEVEEVEVDEDTESLLAPTSDSKESRAKASAKAAQPARVRKAPKTDEVDMPLPRSGSRSSTRREGTPSLISATQMVMGSKTMNAGQVFEGLKAKGWLPNSSDPLGYIRYTLSKNKDIFHRAEGKRGYYTLSKEALRSDRGAASKVTSTHDIDAVVDDVDDLLSKSGIDLSGPNPFAGSNPV
jgi:hypothetical protein